MALELKKKLANSYFMNTVRKQEHQRVAGLVDAIPAFLKCSAMSYRDIVNASKVEHTKDKETKDDKETDTNTDKDQKQDDKENGEPEKKEKVKVLEGWYKLMLELMTQAVIESYLCDENTGFETILDVFSYGDDPKKEEEEVVLKDIVMEDVTVASSPSSSVTGVEGLQFHSLSGLGSTTTMPKNHPTGSIHLHDVTTKDRQDDILFAKTPEYRAFKQAKDERLQEVRFPLLSHLLSSSVKQKIRYLSVTNVSLLYFVLLVLDVGRRDNGASFCRIGGKIPIDCL